MKRKNTQFAIRGGLTVGKGRTHATHHHNRTTISVFKSFSIVRLLIVSRKLVSEERIMGEPGRSTVRVLEFSCGWPCLIWSEEPVSSYLICFLERSCGYRAGGKLNYATSHKKRASNWNWRVTQRFNLRVSREMGEIWLQKSRYSFSFCTGWYGLELIIRFINYRPTLSTRS